MSQRSSHDECCEQVIAENEECVGQTGSHDIRL